MMLGFSILSSHNGNNKKRNSFGNDRNGQYAKAKNTNGSEKENVNHDFKYFKVKITY